MLQEERKVVESMFRAMQMGPEGGDLMMSLFADDAEFTESFVDGPRTHRGKDQIGQAFAELGEHGGDLAITLDRLDQVGGEIRADWTCTSEGFPKPMKGHDLFDIRDGKIHRLEIIVTESPFGDDHA